MSFFCTECGTPAQAGAKFCAKCGTPMQEQGEAGRPAPSAPSAPTAPIRPGTPPPSSIPPPMGQVGAAGFHQQQYAQAGGMVVGCPVNAYAQPLLVNPGLIPGLLQTDYGYRRHQPGRPACQKLACMMVIFGTFPLIPIATMSMVVDGGGMGIMFLPMILMVALVITCLGFQMSKILDVTIDINDKEQMITMTTEPVCGCRSGSHEQIRYSEIRGVTSTTRFIRRKRGGYTLNQVWIVCTRPVQNPSIAGDTVPAGDHLLVDGGIDPNMPAQWNVFIQQRPGVRFQG